MDQNLIFIIIALVIGFIMAWGVGANDLANIMSTTIGSKAISVKQAIVIAVIFEFAGAILGGTNVTNTIRHGIINVDLLANQPHILIYGMLAVLLAGGIWMLFASIIGMPVSITNAIVGGLVGFGAIVLGVNAIHWKTVGAIAISWVCSPLIACISSYILFMLIKRTIFDTRTPSLNARRYTPIYLFLVGIVLGNMTVLKGLAHFNIALTNLECMGVTLGTATLITLFGIMLLKRINYRQNEKLFQQYLYIEKLFSVLMAFTACAMVFAHGSNDVAIAMGPITAIISLAHHEGIQGQLPMWVLWFGCFAVVTGLMMYGRKVIETVGVNITALTPSRAFAATLASATTVIVSTSTGIPVSATQTLVGGVLGVGLARGIGALNMNVIRNIFMSWFVTIPAAAFLAIIFFYVIKAAFGV